MKLTVKKVLLLLSLIIFMLLIFVIISSIISLNIRENKRGEELLTEIIEEAKMKYNLIMNKNDYEVKVIYHTSGSFISGAPIYGIKKKIVYKSKYFKELEETYYEIRANNIMGSADVNSFFGDNGGTELLKVMTDFGLQPYILNTLIYDKSKGNDFKKIEEIFNRYGENIYFKKVSNVWNCGGIGEKFEWSYSLSYVKNINCIEFEGENIKTYNDKVIEKYSKRYYEYFSKPRDFDSIDWEEYMKIHEIYPVLQFFFKDTKEAAEKLQKEIEPYYNKEILDIIIE